MKLTRNMKAISKLLLILLLLTALIIGAILSYLWVVGYYISLDRVYPEDVTVNITDYAFDHQNTSYFNVTIQCPTSYEAKEPADITRITVSTEDGVLHDKINTDPPLPYKFQHKGKSQTFKCLWTWANYTGETIKIIAFVAEGSGPTFEAKTPIVDLRITDVRFDSAISVTHFNITIQNYDVSATYVNITGITVDEEDVIPIVPQVLPSLHPGDSVPLMCSWNWTDYQGKNVTITVETLQGYVAYYPEPPERTTLPFPVVLTITDALFEVTNTTSFNVTVQYSEGFPQYVNITRITATPKNGVPENTTKSVPSLPYALFRGKSVNFTCIWNWTDHREENVTITVYTLQGFTAQYSQATPAPIILEIIEVNFDPRDTTSFNVTVKNSEFSIMNANITEITVTVNGISENITDVVPSLQEGIILPSETNQTFTCFWNWSLYSEKNATIVVQTQEDYSASYLILLKALTITDVLFNPLDTYNFVVTVQNPTWLNFTITTMNVTVEGTASLNITDSAVPSLPFMLPNGTNILFMCSWNWTDYQGRNVTITIETLEGYTTSYTRTIPSE